MEGVGRPADDDAPGRCAYQGAPGAFSHEACIDLRPWDQPVACDSFEAAIDALKAGECSRSDGLRADHGRHWAHGSCGVKPFRR